ncbi:TetR/AcrR family transcriptional regulator [Nonomuraea sp. SBT364]|uniref:TetR/AcrR family transcriptional regulator n=1 Tax=Nonomuraea sp. SBT364 TaxID=1580530 RepID=UPI00069D9406|nr:TetR/AcrR family transcriptional regulator [Nonomuraea sp. SBT364]
MAKAGRPPLDPARQLERAHRILDAAAELILRWGYDKTTIDDVAGHAGVAKGTIYLHWRTRDALFAALLRRERVLMAQEVRAAAPATLRELVRELAAALLRRPLMKALLTGDREVLGKLRAQKPDIPAAPLLTDAFEDYFGKLDRQGALRAGPAGPERLAVVGGGVFRGLFFPAAVLPPPPPRPACSERRPGLSRAGIAACCGVAFRNRLVCPSGAHFMAG